MAKYKLLEKSFIHQRLWDEGEIVDVDDNLVPGPHMQPMDAAARTAVKKYGVVVGATLEHSVVDSIATYGATPAGMKSGMATSE